LHAIRNSWRHQLNAIISLPLVAIESGEASVRKRKRGWHPFAARRDTLAKKPSFAADYRQETSSRMYSSGGYARTSAHGFCHTITVHTCDPWSRRQMRRSSVSGNRRHVYSCQVEQCVVRSFFCGRGTEHRRDLPFKSDSPVARAFA